MGIRKELGMTAHGQAELVKHSSTIMWACLILLCCCVQCFAYISCTLLSIYVHKSACALKLWIHLEVNAIFEWKEISCVTREKKMVWKAWTLDSWWNYKCCRPNFYETRRFLLFFNGIKCFSPVLRSRFEALCMNDLFLHLKWGISTDSLTKGNSVRKDTFTDLKEFVI